MKRLMSHRWSALPMIAFAILAAGVGCGGDSEGSDAALSISSLSEAEYADRVEAICARGRREALQYQPSGAGESQRDALTEVIDGTLLPSLAKVIDEIRALGAPQSEKRQIEGILVAMEEALTGSEDLDPPTIERIEDLFALSGQRARAAGYVSCVYGDD